MCMRHKLPVNNSPHFGEIALYAEVGTNTTGRGMMDREIAFGGPWGSTEDTRAENSAHWVHAAAARQGCDTSVALAGLLDELAFGLAIVDAHRHLLHASRAARQQLARAHGLRLTDGHVEATQPEDGASLQKAIDAAQNGKRGYLMFGRGEHRAGVAIVPLSEATWGDTVQVALVFEKAALGSDLGLYFFAQAYRLTRSEQVVLGVLSSGKSVVEVARELKSSVNTARTHVRGILVKTGLQSVRALIKRLGMLPPLAARVACSAR